MKVKEIFDLSTKMGIEADFRGKGGVQKFLDRKKKKYEALPETGKDDFDVEALVNPYLDSRIHNIAEDKEIKKIMAGIDIDTAELLLSRQVDNIDLVICHHPIGRALASLGDVMELQSDILSHYGVPINIAEALTFPRMSEVARGVSPGNHQKTIDAAKLLKANLINTHTSCDNLAASFLKKAVEKENPERVEDLMELLKSIPEYREAIKAGVGPKIFVGSPDNRCGKIVLIEISGGTGGSPKLYEKMAQAGIGTTVAMHMSEENRKEAEAAHLNVVIAGHISSDSLGMNLFLDELEKQGIEIIPSGGLIRVKRI
ncbi:MAG: NGG1p interacting factor NIF3 [Candidatus Pacebacteria bacterium]|nr:NGG1p interacting factor NIF3 [Candidatus Paceibacterota bacterium]